MVKLAIFFHLGNHSLWHYFRPYIDNVFASNNQTDLYISYQKESNVLDLIKLQYPNVTLIHSLLGCDLGGQLLMTSYVYNCGKEYDYILKLHTKTDEQWRYELIHPLCSCKEVVDYIIQIFNTNETIGMIGSEKWVLSLDRYNMNHDIINAFKKQWNLTSKNPIYFIGGTMFWFRWNIIKNFIKEKKVDFEKEYNLLEPGYRSNNRPTFMHSWERMFAVIMYHYDYLLYGMPLHFNIQTRNPIPDDFDWRIYLACNSDVAKVNYTESFATTHWLNYGIKEGRKYKLDTPFDWKWYVSKYPDLYKNGIRTFNDAIKHYSLYGKFEGRTYIKHT